MTNMFSAHGNTFDASRFVREFGLEWATKSVKNRGSERPDLEFVEWSPPGYVTLPLDRQIDEAVEFLRKNSDVLEKLRPQVWAIKIEFLFEHSIANSRYLSLPIIGRLIREVALANAEMVFTIRLVDDF